MRIKFNKDKLIRNIILFYSKPATFFEIVLLTVAIVGFPLIAGIGVLDSIEIKYKEETNDSK